MINEVSKELLKRYTKAAKTDLRKKTWRLSPNKGGSVGLSKKEYRDMHYKSYNRYSGIHKAEKKISEETLDELSSKLLSKYMSKSLDDVDKRRAKQYKLSDRSDDRKRSLNSRNKDSDKAEKLYDKNVKRHHSMTLATDKMSPPKVKVRATNEETITEVSKELVNRYVDKASKEYKKSDMHKSQLKADSTHERIQAHMHSLKKKDSNRLSGLNRADHKLSKTGKFAPHVAAARRKKYGIGEDKDTTWSDGGDKKYGNHQISKKKRRINYTVDSDHDVYDGDSGQVYSQHKTKKSAMKNLSKYIKRNRKLTSEETLDELSKGTLNRYVRQSMGSFSHANNLRKNAISTYKDPKKHRKTMDKRNKGLGVALDKLREENLDELSKSTLKRYMKKSKDYIGDEDLMGRSRPWSKVKKRADGFNKANKKLKEETIRFKNGESLNLSSKDSVLITKLKKTLKGSNKKKMEDKMMKSKSGFREILAFAKETS